VGDLELAVLPAELPVLFGLELSNLSCNLNNALTGQVYPLNRTCRVMPPYYSCQCSRLRPQLRFRWARLAKPTGKSGRCLRPKYLVGERRLLRSHCSAGTARSWLSRTSSVARTSDTSLCAQVWVLF